MSYKDIQLDESIIIKNRIPLLIKDKNWINLFGKSSNKLIRNLSDELTELINKRRQLTREEDRLKEEKLLAMKMILGISDSINNENKTYNLDLLDEYKEKVESINERLDEISHEQERIQEEIKELNFDLLRATVYYGYKELKKKEKVIKDIDEELESIRKRTKELINKKYDYQEWVQSAYLLLHGFLGREEIEKLDNKILE
ncbi:MAG: aminoacyltransferase [Tissierellia bacterium]|nr:aminoacyltransferase [Tissierellia bacterium]